MDMNRNHWLIIGIVVLFIGLQLRYVESFELNEQATKFINAQIGPPAQAAESQFRLLGSVGPAPRRVIRPPEWLGFALTMTGAVTVLYSLVMPKPAG